MEHLSPARVEEATQVMNNWRVLHGRAGGKASGDRHVVGGTVLREALYSNAKALLEEAQSG